MTEEQRVINKPSKYQEAIYCTQITTNHNIIINATAGSGKTSTLVELSKIIPYGKKAVFVAFNKSIVKELRERLPESMECSTMHSIGCKAIFSHYPGEKKIEEKKQIGFIEPFFREREGEKENKREKWVNIYQVDRLMMLARATMCPITREGLNKLCDLHALDITEENIGITIKALRKLNEYNEREKRNIRFDFMDMIALVALNKNIRVSQFDYVFLDEAQDCSILDQLLIDRLIKPGTGRLIICGDENQSIYNFKGADPNSFANFMKRPNTVQLPLSISYRCSKKIVKKAQTVYQDIEEFEGNEEGIVSEKGKLEDVQEGDMVICRNSRPLVFAYLELIKQGKKAVIIGREIEKGLLSMLSPYNQLDRCEEVLKVIKDKTIEKIKKEFNAKGVVNFSNHPRYIETIEKLEIIKLLLNKYETIAEVERFIEDIFNDDERDGVQLMTIHKSKGLESERVFVIEKFEGTPLIPSKWAITDDQKKAERNLRFVSYTRAKKELVILSL